MVINKKLVAGIWKIIFQIYSIYTFYHVAEGEIFILLLVIFEFSELMLMTQNEKFEFQLPQMYLVDTLLMLIYSVVLCMLEFEICDSIDSCCLMLGSIYILIIVIQLLKD